MARATQKINKNVKERKKERKKEKKKERKKGRKIETCIVFGFTNRGK